MPALFGATALLAFVLLTVIFAVACLRGRFDTVDSAWGAGFVVITLGTLVLSRWWGMPVSGVAWLLAAMTAVWGLRLSIHIHLRGRGAPEDPRYREILDRARKYPRLRMYVRAYLSQAAVLWFVSLTLQIGLIDLGGPPLPTGVVAAGVVLWLVGMVFEVVGDEQLRRFRADPSQAGRVLDRGLWRYTRHPNYFGDACVWWGLFLVACHQPASALTVLSPLVMTWLLAKGSGKPLLERRLRQRRPEYADYVARTSGFFPLPPRRARG